MAHTNENIDELVLSQEYATAPRIHRTMHLFEQKYDIIVNLTFPYWKLLFFLYQFLITVF